MVPQAHLYGSTSKHGVERPVDHTAYRIMRSAVHLLRRRRTQRRREKCARVCVPAHAESERGHSFAVIAGSGRVRS